MSNGSQLICAAAMTLRGIFLCPAGAGLLCSRTIALTRSLTGLVRGCEACGLSAGLQSRPQTVLAFDELFFSLARSR